MKHSADFICPGIDLPANTMKIREAVPFSSVGACYINGPACNDLFHTDAKYKNYTTISRSLAIECEATCYTEMSDKENNNSVRQS